MAANLENSSVVTGLGKVSFHPAYLTYMQSTSCKMMGWMKHKLESRILEWVTISFSRGSSLPRD